MSASKSRRIEAADVVELIQRYFSFVPEDKLRTTAHLRDDLGLDSIHLVELQVHLETAVGARFSPLDSDFLDAFEDITSLARYASRVAAEGD